VADPTSAKTVLSVEQPFSNHNGGLITFGPDGMLYVGLGDGGSGGDPLNSGQDVGTLLGSILRIDVNAGDPYAIPADNPFVNDPAARDEIWAYGLRNPWRFAFDREADVLFVADVGQNSWEEVNAVPASAGALNFGWRLMEGNHCFNPPSCSPNGLVRPVVEYDHDDGCSITGGFVYRGAAIPSIRGHYFYSDFCSGWLRSFAIAGGQATDHTDWDVGRVGNVVSFGEDATGELYVVVQDGRVLRLAPAD
jgi:glucose/arabinose dehydrogenase